MSHGKSSPARFGSKSRQHPDESSNNRLGTIDDDSSFKEQESDASNPDLGAYDYEAETNRIVKKTTSKSSAASRRSMFKKSQTLDSVISQGLNQNEDTINLIKLMVKRESKRKPSMFSKSGKANQKQGKVFMYDQILPVKQRYDKALFTVNRSIQIIQKWCRKLKLRIHRKKAIGLLNKFVKGYYFDKCRELFYADLFRIDEKKVEQQERHQKREQYLTKLRPMKNRILTFKNRTFRIDTLSRDVQWATEKRLQKGNLPPIQVGAKTATHFSQLGDGQKGKNVNMQSATLLQQAQQQQQMKEDKSQQYQMVSIKKSDVLSPNFDDQLEQVKKASFLIREKDRLSSKEERVWHAVKHGDSSRIQQIFKDQKEAEKAASAHDTTNKKKSSSAQAAAKRRIDINKKDKHGMSSLVVAIDNGKYEIANTLISEQGADVNSRFGKDNNTALHLACKRAAQNTDPEKQQALNNMVELLLKHGADPNALNKNLETPVALTNGRMQEDQFLDTCVSHCITFEAFVESARASQRYQSADQKSAWKSSTNPWAFEKGSKQGESEKSKRMARKFEHQLSYAQQQRLGFLTVRTPKSLVTPSQMQRAQSHKGFSSGPHTRFGSSILTQRSTSTRLAKIEEQQYHSARY